MPPVYDQQKLISLLEKWKTSGLTIDELNDLEGNTKKLLGEVKLHKCLTK